MDPWRHRAYGHGMLDRAAAVGRTALDFLLPPGCPGCEAPVDAQGRFCAPCFAALTFVGDPLCDVCGLPFALGGQGGIALCRDCHDRPPPYRRARGALRYDEFAKRLVLPLKYADRTEFAPVLAGFMARAGARLLERAEVIVPVPLARARLRQRRYNQAALLARGLGRRAGRVVASGALARRDDGVTTHDLGREARFAAMRDAVSVRRASAVAGKRVLLVDDVMTTGATASACAAALVAAGARAAEVLVACRAGHAA